MYLFFIQLRSFCIDYAEACGHFATAIKLIEQEINEKGASRILDEKLIQVSVSVSVVITVFRITVNVVPCIYDRHL